MDFRILGALEIRSDDGAEIVVGAPKLRALLISLLLDVGRVVPSDRLVDDLWGDGATAHAMDSLRSYVSHLRRLLPTGDGAPLLVSRGRGYVLDVDPVRVDAVRFETAVRTGRELLTNGAVAQALTVLESALASWRGPALLDVVDEPFARPAAARLEELRVAAAEERLEAMLALGRHAETVAEAEALVAAHPLRERPRRQLLLALHRTGRSPEALTVHRTFRRLLAEDLGLDPSVEFDALAEAVLRRDPDLDGVPPAVPDVQVVVPGGSGASASPLIGRTDEQARLAAAVDQSTRGTGQVLLLAGEPGIGKTSLLAELQRRARAADVPVAWGRCHESEGAPAFWPWVQVLRALAEQVDDPKLARLTAGTAAAVSHLVPEIGVRTGRHEPLPDADLHTARFLLDDAVATFLGRAAADRGLVVCLDDVHWADPATLELVGFLGAQARAAGIVLAVGYRDTDADRSADLDAALAVLAREDATRNLSLRGLSLPDVAALAAAVTGAPIDDAVAAEMHRRAGGNPFFVRQLAQLRADAYPSGCDGDPVPVGVRHVLLRRFQLLPAEVRATLDVASVLGQEFDARVLATCLGAQLADVLDHLDLAAGHGLVAGTTGATGWRFLHVLIRDTLHDELRPSRLARLHAAAADALEAQAAAPVQAIAEHLWFAADLVDPARPVAWLRAAAEDALAVHGHEQGERYLRRVLHLLSHRSDADPGVELAVRLRLVQVVVGLHGWSAPGIVEVAARARELAGAAGLGPELTSLWWSRWAFSMTRGDLEDAAALARQLLDDVVALGSPAELVAGHVAMAYTAIFRGGAFEEVAAHLDAARHAESIAEPETLAMTPERLAVASRVTGALAEAFLGEPERACDLAADALDTARRVGTPFSEGYARLFGGIVAAVLDRPDQARDVTEPGLELCERLHLRHLAHLIVPSHAWACARLGEDPARHAASIESAVDGLLDVGHRHAAPLWWLLLAEVRVLAGDVEGAEAALSAGLALSAETGEDVYDRQRARVESVVRAARRDVSLR